jgi:hypothetical protein
MGLFPAAIIPNGDKIGNDDGHGMFHRQSSGFTGFNGIGTLVAIWD